MCFIRPKENFTTLRADKVKFRRRLPSLKIQEKAFPLKTRHISASDDGPQRKLVFRMFVFDIKKIFHSNLWNAIENLFEASRRTY